MYVASISLTCCVHSNQSNGNGDVTVTSNSTQTPCDLSPHTSATSEDVQPEAHHQNPGHCVASFSAISRMRENAQVRQHRSNDIDMQMDNSISTYGNYTVYFIQLCDVVLDVGGEMINAHKLILASVSPYFYAMFNGEFEMHFDENTT